MVQNSRRELKGVREKGVGKKLYENEPQKRFFFLIFDIYYVALKLLIYVMSYTGYASLVKFLLEFELIEAHLSSCRHFSAYLG